MFVFTMIISQITQTANSLNPKWRLNKRRRSRRMNYRSHLKSRSGWPNDKQIKYETQQPLMKLADYKTKASIIDLIFDISHHVDVYVKVGQKNTGCSNCVHPDKWQYNLDLRSISISKIRILLIVNSMDVVYFIFRVPTFDCFKSNYFYF